MTRTRAWSAGVAVACLLLVLAAWFLAVSPKRAEAADLRDQAVAQQAANEQTRLRTEQLAAQYVELPAREAELKVVARQMPAATQLASIVRTVTTMAASAGVSVRSVTPTAPQAGAPPAGQATGPATGPAVTPMATKLVVAGSYASVTLFLQKLQAAAPSPRGTTMARAFLVQAVNVVPDPSTPTPSTPGSNPGSNPAGAGRVQLTVTGRFFVMDTAPVPTITIAPAR